MKSHIKLKEKFSKVEKLIVAILNKLTVGVGRILILFA